MIAATWRIDDNELACLIEHGESARVEFKETLGGNAPERIREAVCAFANDLSRSGKVGIVAIGVKDSGAPSGIDIDDEMLRQLTDIRSDGNILPPPALLVEKRRYRGKKLAVLTVLPSDSPPVRYKGVIHVRYGPRRGIATAQDERVLNERRRFGDRPFDLHPVTGAGVDDLGRRRFEEEYLPRLVPRDVLEANDRSFVERLASTKMIASVDDPRATILGLCVIGNRPRDFLPGAYVQFRRIGGQELTDETIDEEQCDGTMSDTLRRLDEKLKSHNRRRIDLTSGDLERRTESYPLVALQQLTRNAVMHRNYEGTNAPVRVHWYDDRIEILSPGGPFGAVTEENFGHPGFADYRNPGLAEAMRVLGYVQKFGTGITTAQRLLQESGHPKATFDARRGHVLATVRALPAQREMSR